MIAPFNEAQLTPNGYDLKIEEVSFSKYTGNDFEKPVSNFYLKPNDFIKVKTLETLKMPNDVVAFMYLRSRYTRQGLLGLFAVVDAGFNGKIIASLKNVSNTSIELKLDEGVIHIVFEQMDNPSMIPYGTTENSHFQNQM